MWTKITSHIGLWLGLEEADDRPMRASCSLSMLHNSHLAVVRSSKSSENLHQVAPVRVQITEDTVKTPRKTSILTLRRGRNKEKKSKNTNGKNGMTNSWYSHDMVIQNSSYNVPPQPTTPTKTIFGFLKPSRSRSSKLTNEVVSGTMPSTSTSMTNLRRRRPRSAHYDPNTITASHTEIAPENVEEYYKKIEKLGEGSYAKVYKCESKEDGSIVALKEISLNFQEGLPFTAIREASLLRTLRHANIVCLHDIFHQHHQLTFVFEYMKMDLSKYLEDKTCGLESIEIKLLLFQLLRGLDFCHRKKILHRDLKPQNLLLDEDGTLKLADFGLARAKSVPSQTYSNEVVTLWYRPPDVLLGSTNYSTSLDMWGVGCIFAEICTGNAIFPGTHDFLGQLDKIFSVRGSPQPHKWPEVLQLPYYKQYAFPRYHELSFMAISHLFAKILKSGQELLGMFLQLDPEKRVSAASAMLHPYFASLPREVHLLAPTHSIFRLKELRNIHSF